MRGTTCCKWGLIRRAPTHLQQIDLFKSKVPMQLNWEAPSGRYLGTLVLSVVFMNGGQEESDKGQESAQ